MNFRDVSFGLRKIRLLGLIHSNAGIRYIPENLRNATEFRSDVYLVETSAKSLELSEFVFRTRDASVPLEKFCTEESHLNETIALAARELTDCPNAQIFPIDVDPSITRRRLAKSALLHPIESLKLISRYHGKSENISSVEEVGKWRSAFQAACPHAYEILFTDRELHMCNEIDRISNAYDRTLVLMGLSHVDAIYNLLTDRLVAR